MIRKLFPLITLGLVILLSGCASREAVVRKTAEKVKAFSVFECLPPEIIPDKPIMGSPSITIAEKLHDLNATCREGKLVDGSGREIRFFWWGPCGGMYRGPEQMMAIHEQESKELADLQSKYTVIQIQCPRQYM
jgi:hypothetical protein